MRTAVYAGSFDPITLGHWYMIETGAKLFDRLIVAVAVNPNKKPWFTVEERLDMIRHSVDRPWESHLKHVELETIQEDQFLVKYAKEQGADFLLRGLRSEQDFDYEKVMRLVNRDMHSEIETVFLMPPREIAEVSSSMVKSLVGHKGWQDVILKYVPKVVHTAILKKVLGE